MPALPPCANASHSRWMWENHSTPTLRVTGSCPGRVNSAPSFCREDMQDLMGFIRCVWQGAAAWLQRADKAIKAIVSSKHCLLTQQTWAAPELRLQPAFRSHWGLIYCVYCSPLLSAGKLSTALRRGVIPAAFCSLLPSPQSGALPWDPAVVVPARGTGSQGGLWAETISPSFCSPRMSHGHVWEVKERCQDTLWVKAAKKDTWERTGILLNPKGLFQHRAGRKGDRFPTTLRGRRDTRGEAEGNENKANLLSWLRAGAGTRQSSAKGCFTQHHLGRTQTERISLAGWRASQIQYLSTLPHPSPGSSSVLICSVQIWNAFINKCQILRCIVSL